MARRTLGDLIQEVQVQATRGDLGTVISHVTYDSRDVAGPGALFAAVPGLHVDGHNFIPQAVERGATAVLVSRDVQVPDGVAVVRVADARAALAEISRTFYGDPSARLKVVGVTGTKGKTTTTHIITAVLEAAGHGVGLIGTVSYRTGLGVRAARNTTPEASDLQALMGEMEAAGQTHAVMEVSSHAVALDRIALVDFDVGVFTNIGHDHLDFHGTMDNYIAAKAAFFRSLGRYGRRQGKPWPKRAVINADDAHWHAMAQAAEEAGALVTTYACGRPADFRAEDISLDASGIRYRITRAEPPERAEVKSPLLGRFNVKNTLAAIVACTSMGLDLGLAAKAVEGFSGVPGRFESVRTGLGFSVVVDYAHSPDSLQSVLETARDVARARVICVFGCGGDRDRTKRPLMGRISGEMADYTIVTSDNPRSEDPEAIITEIVAGVGSAPHEAVTDRREAIRRAVRMARAGDLVLIAGKGHETYQIFRDRTVHFDDREEVRAALGEMEMDAGV
ncbi:MAG: UDP-N-acetylmuramoyl-L-alanyl-D-glutamate--2,6-diaminopimelate ligase [Firmicutes bacterium]|nr:UDP-N-acetylmuramoyl-L-alanyl-D-glutamate--2,6-diaminopimelate ligase [Bacillota bacterium]